MAQNIILLRIDGNYPKHLFESGLMQGLSRKTPSYVKVSWIRRCSRNDVLKGFLHEWALIALSISIGNSFANEN